MNQPKVFQPIRRNGLLFHCAALVASSGLCTYLVLAGIRQQESAYTALLLIAALLCFAPLPIVAYRLYALVHGHYQLDRDRLHLRWGLRAEEIPLADIEWVRPAADLPILIPSPRFSWPGALLGTVVVEGLGPVEFIASEREALLLVATPARIFAIAPGDYKGFLSAIREAFEMGSLAEVSALSVLPAAYLARIWNDRPARWLLVASTLLTLLLFVGVSLAIPGRALTSLGFYPTGEPLPTVPSGQMLLLPILGLLFFGIDLGGGLYFYRWDALRPLAYVLWGSSILTSLLLMGASLWIL